MQQPYEGEDRRKRASAKQPVENPDSPTLPVSGERWQTPDGRNLEAPLPAGVRGHFGPELRRFVLQQHHQGQVTAERITAFLAAPASAAEPIFVPDFTPGTPEEFAVTVMVQQLVHEQERVTRTGVPT